MFKKSGQTSQTNAHICKTINENPFIHVRTRKMSLSDFFFFLKRLTYLTNQYQKLKN